ncbi:putative DNA binding domain-containing protein [Streptococcus sanguinis]|uniref:AlbA family DNA-binding domain-containing protein n=1 Tax=Streptococcus sanguinis TaxID=1305 RepID=UPI0022843644|nr:ATP-binding protein [Streptococcus sanguinis]MCY7017918.1 putative DNA binding domain-containing protein [Streptococcus sanguinis]
MLTNDQLDEIVRELIYLGVEGEYWDFKEKPYFFEGQSKEEKNKKKNDFLHDIICMANNLSNHDAYIIMGIQDKPVKITEVKQFSNKWTQENYQDFLQNLTWAGDMIPTVEFRTINNGDLDVLIIKKSNRVPYYITKNYGKVRENRIYVRKGSKNTAIDSQAEIGDIEKLFEFRFGLTPFPKERVINYITDHDHWIEMKGNYETRSWYYEKFPEYTLELVDDPQNDKLKAPVYALIHPNARTTWQILRLKYHQTILLEFSSHYIDEYRGISVQPKYNFLKLFDRMDDMKFPSMYYYYLSDSVEINLMYLLKDLLQQDGEAWRRHLSLIPVFYDDVERNVIEEYIEENKSDIIDKIKKESENICLGYNYDGDEKRSKWDQEEIAVTKVVKNILNEYREKKVYEKTK